jgi:uncharacterized lipoprotein YddW (UPF0748 family)
MFAVNPKREFRGAWLHTVFQDQYLNRTTEQNKKYLRTQLDSLRDAGVNAILFQVRPQSDAFYDSKLEPWSRFLTNDGKAPSPYWDPLQFMVEEAHARGMELHAWLNPYRVTSSKNQKLPAGHIYYKHRERFVTFDGKLYFDPGLPENRKFIEDVVLDIVNRYDVDGIHFDDYFYPYPVKGVTFPDSKSFAKYGDGMKLADWRRHNVDMLIEEVHQLIADTKPWVRFGISPFGIWRNKTNDSRGSDTRGLQNYDDLYADVLLWAEKGWVDYILPQLYWELEHKSASYLVLVDWWNKHAYNRHMYIGQDVNRSMKFADIAPSTDKSQLRHKVELTRASENIQGNCWWPGYAITRNEGGAADILREELQSTIALCPSYPWISDAKPAAVSDLQCNDRKLTWTAAEASNKTCDVVRFVVYYFKTASKIDLENAEAIVAVTNRPEYTSTRAGIYVVTALDRVNNESDPVKITVK